MSSPSDRPNAPITYRDAGVNIDAGNALVNAIKPLVKATRRPGSDADIGGFGGLFDLKAAGFHDPILVAANDGVGTKLKLAIETGKHDTIGIDLVAMCVNDLIVQGAEPLFFLDYFSCGQLDHRVAENVVAGIAEGCRQAGCALIGGETAEMPGMYRDGDYDLAGFAVGAAERGQLLPRGDITAGDVVLGLAASGVHSNGYSLVRRLVTDSGLNWHTPAPYDRNVNLGDSLLTPTRIYAKSVLTTLKDGSSVKALAHITGGGLIENIPRILPDGLKVKLDATCWQAPPVFTWLKQASGLDDIDFARTFNTGIGMIAIVSPEQVDHVVSLLSGAGEAVLVIGSVLAQQPAEPSQDRVVLQGALRFMA